MANKMIAVANWAEVVPFFDEVAKYIDVNIAKKFKLGLENYDCSFNATWASIIVTFYISKTQDTFSALFRYDGIANLLNKEPDEYGILQLDGLSPTEHKILLDWCVGYTWDVLQKTTGFRRAALELIKSSWQNTKISELAETCINIIRAKRNIDITFDWFRVGAEFEAPEIVYMLNGKNSGDNVAKVDYIEMAQAMYPLSSPELDLVWYDEINLNNLTKEKEINLGKYLMQKIWDSIKTRI